MSAAPTLEDFFDSKPQKPWEVEGVGWKEVRLGNVCVINPKKSEIKDLLKKNIEVSFVPMEYVDDVEGKIIKFDVRPIQEVYKGYTYFRDGDVIFAKITPCMENGKAAVVKGLKNTIGFGSTEFHVIRPKENILPEYIFYFIRRKAYRKEAEIHFTGTVGHRRVPKEFVIGTKVPLPFRNGKPDLETQKKIVEYIEANFSRIDKILEKKKKELERLDELWESVLEQAFKPKEGEEWRGVKLKDISIINPKKSEVRKLLDENEEVSFVPMEYVDDEQGKIVKMKIRPLKEVYTGYTYFRDGDVIFAKITPCMENGKSAIATGLKNGIGFGSTEFHVIRPKDNIFSKYIFYFVRRKSYREEAAQHFTGTVGHRRVPKEFIMNSKIPLPFHNNQPDLEKQKEIANYLDGVYEKIKALKEKIQGQISHLEEMKESILEEVFGHEK